MDATSPDTLVLGAGLAGLACAHALRRSGARPRVLEAEPRAGGLVRTIHQDGFRFEEGPEAVPGFARTVRELCAELGLALQETAPGARRRYLALEGKLVEIPSSAEDLATSRVLSFGAKLRLMAEPSCARDEALDGSIADFARHRFGQEVLERLVEPLVAGLLAGDPERLSLRATFPALVRLVEEHGSVFAALKARARPKKAAWGAPPPAREPLGGGLLQPAGGMGALPEALARSLGPALRTGDAALGLEREADGYRVRTASGAVHRAPRVVLALPLASARALLASAAPGAAAALGSVAAESLISVVHAYRRSDVRHALDGFGYLGPRRAGALALATFFSSSLVPGTAPEGHVLLRTLLGGARAPEALELPEAELLARLRAECAPLLGLDGAPVLTRLTRYREVFPRFDLEHTERLRRLAQELPAGLFVLGNFTRGLDLESVVAEARDLARTLAPL